MKNYAKQQARKQIAATREAIRTLGIKKVLEQAKLASGFFPEQKTLINTLSALTVCRKETTEGSLIRQEIDSLHAQVWEQLIETVKHYY